MLECFTRPELPGLNVAELLPHPRPASGRSVVVIGAGRGFGAAVTLALLGQGHEAHAVSSTAGGALDEARRLAGTHAERLLLHQADAGIPGDLAPLPAALAERGLPLQGIVLAAAPPPVPMGLTAESASALADYVAASVRLAAVPLGALLHLLEADGFVLFCSSSAVTAPPHEWPHYVAAKGALEGLAGWTAVAAPGVRTVVARLPKLLTGMTNSPGMRSGPRRPKRSRAGWSTVSRAAICRPDSRCSGPKRCDIDRRRDGGDPALAGSARPQRDLHVLQRGARGVGGLRVPTVGQPRELGSDPHAGRGR